MKWLLEDITTYLQTIGIGTVGTNIFAGNLPETPVKALSVFCTGGAPSGKGTLRPSVQILMRDAPGNFGDVASLADYVFEILDDKWNILPRFKGRMTAMAPPGANYRESGNWIFSLNFQVLTTVTTIGTPANL